MHVALVSAIFKKNFRCITFFMQKKKFFKRSKGFIYYITSFTRAMFEAFFQSTIGYEAFATCQL